MDLFEKSQHTLELPAVLELLAAEAVSAPARELAQAAKQSIHRAEVERMLAEIDAKETPVSIVLNNAGLQIAYRVDYLNTPASDYTESFKINTVAPAMICYHFLPRMIENGFGRILNTTSGIALDPHQAGYSAST